MKKLFIIAITSLLCLSLANSKTWRVQKNGLGDFTNIGQAINVAKNGDTVKVYPGIYEEKVVLAKDIVVQGSGAEATMISNQNKDYALDISAGKLMWFSITSAQDGVKASGGILTNCVAINCQNSGIVANPKSKILNCITKGCIYGIWILNNVAVDQIINNCISVNNQENGIVTSLGYGGARYQVQYCNTYFNKYQWGNYADKSIGSLETDPKFIPNSYQISDDSPCKNTGNPAYQDPDGTISDMGYYGGPDAPTFPVVKSAKILLNPDGTIELEAVGISPY